MKSKEERVTQVRSKINGDVFYTSNRYKKIVDGQTFVGVFKHDGPDRHINWMRKDFIMEVEVVKKR
jgi:hypothetical protein